MQQEQCLESQVKKVIQNDLVDSVYCANGDVRIGDCVIKTASAKKCVKAEEEQEEEEEAENGGAPSNSDGLCKVASDEEEPPDFVCKLCGLYTDCQGDLLEHMTAKHAREKKHQCDLCDFRCYTNNTLKRHRQTHSTEKPFLCEICQKRFHFSDYLKRHILTHREKEKQFKCAKCDYCSAYHCNLQYHIAREHSTSKLFMCDVCDYKFVTGDELKKHLLSHSPLNFDDCDLPVEPPKRPKRSTARKEIPPPVIGTSTPATTTPNHEGPYKCYDCSFQSACLESLIQHIEKKCTSPTVAASAAVVVDDSGKLPPRQREKRVPNKFHKCEECEYNTPNGSHLRRHMQAKHSTDCDVCSFKGATSDDLRQHRPVHSEKKNAKCPHCRYSSPKPELLKHHMLKKHSASDDSQS